MKLQFHHIAIICSNIEASQDFYRNLFGFKVIQKNYREDRQSWKIDMRKDEVQIELFSFPDSPKRLTQPEACGLRHIAFAVKSVDAWHAKFAMMKIKSEEIQTDQATNRRFFFIKDPDGLPIELYESECWL